MWENRTQKPGSSATAPAEEQYTLHGYSIRTEQNILFCVFFCRYSLRGDTKKYFSIGKYSGELKTVQALDREENSTYTMEVVAEDGRKKCFILPYE